VSEHFGGLRRGGERRFQIGAFLPLLEELPHGPRPRYRIPQIPIQEGSRKREPGAGAAGQTRRLMTGADAAVVSM
jgi:hypothetical protein